MLLNRHALRVIRERSGLSISALADPAGISQPHLSNIESGRRRASAAVISQLAVALKVPLVVLLADVDGEEEPDDGDPPSAPPGLSRPARGSGPRRRPPG